MFPLCTCTLQLWKVYIIFFKLKFFLVPKMASVEEDMICVCWCNGGCSWLLQVFEFHAYDLISTSHINGVFIYFSNKGWYVKSSLFWEWSHTFELSWWIQTELAVCKLSVTWNSIDTKHICHSTAFSSITVFGLPNSLKCHGNTHVGHYEIMCYNCNTEKLLLSRLNFSYTLW